MQNLSGRDFYKKRTLWLGFGEAKPNLTFLQEKITFILGFSLGKTPSENQHTLRRNQYPSTSQIAWKYTFNAPRSGQDTAIAVILGQVRLDQISLSQVRLGLLRIIEKLNPEKCHFYPRHRIPKKATYVAFFGIPKNVTLTPPPPSHFDYTGGGGSLNPPYEIISFRQRLTYFTLKCNFR